MKDLYSRSCISLKREVEADIKRQKDLPCLWISSITIMKIAILSKSMYMFNAIPIKIAMTFLTEIEKSAVSFIWKYKSTQMDRAILTKKRAILDVSQYLTSMYTTEP
jgi:hypothetical protein